MDHFGAFSEEGQIACGAIDTTEKLYAVYEVLAKHSHVCGGRDCIGYLVEGDSATQYRCSYCDEIHEALDAVKE